MRKPAEKEQLSAGQAGTVLAMDSIQRPEWAHA
jgi:hypothetical protein